MDLEKRFLKYVSFDTQSQDDSATTPSTLKQLELGKYLANELKSIGCKDVFLDQYGIVYGMVEANTTKAVPTIGVIAHMDTSPSSSGANIKPRIIKNYDGSDITLSEGIIMKVSDFPTLKDNIGEDLIVTDGKTLLGADDKAGVAIIVETIYRLINDKNHEHGTIKIAFTPDEEVGRGTENFDVKFFNADLAYTLDGGDIHLIEYECFNASSAKVEISGISIHPGSAKDKMVNANLLALEFDALLPQDEIPSKTEKYQGFHHLEKMEGDVEKANLYYIIRNHDRAILKRQENDLIEASKTINKKYGKEFIKVTISESYHNMREYIEPHKEVLERIEKAYQKEKVAMVYEPIRGGTDGAWLSEKGLPTPNLPTGGYNFHGPFEYVSLTQMRQLVKILLTMLKA